MRVLCSHVARISWCWRHGPPNGYMYVSWAKTAIASGRIACEVLWDS